MRTNSQGTTEIIKTKFNRNFCRLVQSIVITDLATIAPFRFILQAMNFSEKFLRCIGCFQILNCIACFLIEVADKLLSHISPPLILRLRMNIGVGKINCHIRILAEIFQGIGRARGTTSMHKNRRAFLILFPNLNHFLHDTVIIDFLVEIHLAQNFFYINHHFLLFLSLFYHIED